MNLSIPPSLENVVLFCRTNTIFTDSSADIADCIVNFHYFLCTWSSTIDTFIIIIIFNPEGCELIGE